MASGLENGTAAAFKGMHVTIGQTYSAGYYSGERFGFSRARQDYECHCGCPDHKIKKGDLYMFIIPDRMASMGGEKYRHTLNVAHVNWHLIVEDKHGNVVARFNK